jgi:hypothetical protein
MAFVQTLTTKVLLPAAVSLLLVPGSFAYANAFNLPDTGQSKCYQGVSPYAEIPCTGTGQDGEYTINPMSYTDNGDGTVKDNNTGLMWQKEDDGSVYNWYQASGIYNATYNPDTTDVCGSLNLGGYPDWRLPTRKELVTIVDFSVPLPGPTIVESFANTSPAFYWSSTSGADDPGLGGDVYFGSGLVGASYKNAKYYVRCVREGTADAGTFVDNKDSTVTDIETGLLWQKEDDGITRTWDEALSYCESLNLAFQSDWRLPNIRELESITDDSRYNPAVPVFTGASDSYWSSTSLASSTNQAWLVYSVFGSVDYYVKDNYDSYFHVRCVRAGETGSLIFHDIPPGFWADKFIYAIYNAGITSGCGNDNYCPDDSVTRAQMAVFMVKALGETPAATCSGMFDDVSEATGDNPAFCKYIEKFSTLGITAGCGGSNFCPGELVTRAQMAVFITKAIGEAAASCTGTVFNDVNGTVMPSAFCGFIEKFSTLGITSGCGGGNYCPNDLVTRAQMAVFLTKGFLQ